MTFDYICTQGLRKKDLRQFSPSINALELDFGPTGNINRIWDRIEMFTGNRLEPTTRDLVEIASALYMADRCSKRKKDLDNMRHIRILIPTREPTTLNQARNSIESAIRQLRCDHVELQFVKRNAIDDEPVLPDSEQIIEGNCVVLLSGGIDSFCGAAYSIFNENLHPILVSYYTSNRKVQISVRSALEREFNESIQHLQIPNIRPRGRTHTGAKCLPRNEEDSQRLRSFFFGVLAIATASSLDIQKIRMVDNAIMSAAIPLNSARVGSYRTRTTHPYFIESMEKVASDIIPHDVSIINTMAFRSKDDIVRYLDRSNFTSDIGFTISCARFQAAQRRGKKHCGYCIPCILRRLALMSTNLESVDPISNYQYNFLKFESLPDEGRLDLLDMVSFCADMENMTMEELSSNYPDFYGFSINPDEVEEIIKIHKKFGNDVLGVLRQKGSKKFRRLLRL